MEVNKDGRIAAMTYPDHDRYSDPEETTPKMENESAPEMTEEIPDRIDSFPDRTDSSADTTECTPLQGEFAPLVSEEAPEGPPERRTSDEMIETMFNSVTGGGEPSRSYDDSADPAGGEPEESCASGEEDFSAYSD